MAAFLKEWVFATQFLRFNLRIQVVTFWPLPLSWENERVKRCDY